MGDRVMDMELESLKRAWIEDIKETQKRESRCDVGEDLKLTYKRISMLMDQANEMITKLVEENKRLREDILETQHELKILRLRYADQKD
jgi:hypothetical protein